MIASLYQFNIIFNGNIYEFKISIINGRLIIDMPNGIEIPKEVIRMAKILTAVNYKNVISQTKNMKDSSQLNLFK